MIVGMLFRTSIWPISMADKLDFHLSTRVIFQISPGIAARLSVKNFLASGFTNQFPASILRTRRARRGKLISADASRRYLSLQTLKTRILDSIEPGG